MATNVELERATYWALDGKQIVLAQYCQELLSRESEDPDLVRIEFGRAKIELDLVFAKLMQMSNSTAIALPDAETVGRLQQNVAILAELVNANTQLGVLIEKGDALIRAWPN